MDKPILIGIHGVKRAGKDTSAHFIKEWAGASEPAFTTFKRGFADKAKWAYARQFYPKITMAAAIKWVDTFKESTAQIFFPDPSLASDDSEWEYNPVPFRLGMAQFATDGARDIYGDDFWADQLLPLGMMEHDPYPNWVTEFEIHDPEGPRPADICLITDLRFENEVTRIHEVGGKCLKIKRREAEEAVIEEARRQGREVHRSELGLPDELFDYVINNDDNDMDKAKQRTIAIMEFWVNKKGVIR